jgi:CDP-diacylglycerol--glycerol-3-phosphate 3-phosphatidyltransferase
MNYRDYLQKVIYVIINPIIKGMIRIGLTPNIVTTLGFIGNLVATACFLWAAWLFKNNSVELQLFFRLIGWGGLIILLAGLFDMMDGRLARMGNMSSTFGALWDSTLDRYSDLVTLFGILMVFVEVDWV